MGGGGGNTYFPPLWDTGIRPAGRKGKDEHRGRGSAGGERHTGDILYRSRASRHASEQGRALYTSIVYQERGNCNSRKKERMILRKFYATVLYKTELILQFPRQK